MNKVFEVDRARKHVIVERRRVARPRGYLQRAVLSVQRAACMPPARRQPASHKERVACKCQWRRLEVLRNVSLVYSHVHFAAKLVDGRVHELHMSAVRVVAGGTRCEDRVHWNLRLLLKPHGRAASNETRRETNQLQCLRVVAAKAAVKHRQTFTALTEMCRVRRFGRRAEFCSVAAGAAPARQHSHLGDHLVIGGVPVEESVVPKALAVDVISV